jgi:cytochrome c oxidase assembly protein subunit 15
MLGVQVALGVTTLLLGVPIPLAAAHQAGALLLFSLALWTAHELSRGNEPIQKDA